MTIPYCYLAIQTDHKFYSPDETANFVFTKSFIETNHLYLEEPLNILTNNIISPRSVNVIGDKLVPQSFIGLPLIYGLIGKIFSIKIVTYLTPLFSLLGVLLFFLLIKEVFSKNVAFFSSLLLLFNPVYWYLAGKSMIHNNLLLVLVISGLYFLFKAKKFNKTILYVLSATCFGLSIWVRTSEVIWIGLIVLLFYLFYCKQISTRQVAWFTGISLISVAGLLAINYSIYDFIFRTGYSSLETNSGFSIFDLIKQIIIPFGFNIKILWFNFYEFLIKYLWFLVLPGFFGIIYTLKIKLSKEQRFYTWSTIITSAYLIIFYGSYWPWGQSGQPSEPQIMIGSPHLRYWLPILLFLSPFIVIFSEKVLKSIYENKVAKKVPFFFISTVLLITIIFSTTNVFYDKKEGFIKIKNDIAEFEPRLAGVKENVEPDSILVVPDWADRIFFPQYKVIHSIDDPLVREGDAYLQFRKLLEKHPVYFYNANSEKDIEALNINKLNALSLKLEKVKTVYKSEKLYKLIQHEEQ